MQTFPDKTDAIFVETQHFKQAWVWITLIAVAILVPFSAIIGLVKGFETKGVDYTGLVLISIFAIIVPLLVLYLFYIIKLETIIKNEGVYVRLYPFQLQFKSYLFTDLSKCYVREYNPIKEYGGWGLRGFGKNKALNVSGNKGMQLETKDGYLLLIGTNKQLELTEILQRHKH